MSDRDDAADRLRGLLDRGATVWTVLRHVSRSGMSRRISVIVVEDGRPRDVSFLVARVTAFRLHRDGGVAVGGTGMDMGFHVVCTMAKVLYGDGYALDQEWL